MKKVLLSAICFFFVFGQVKADYVFVMTGTYLSTTIEEGMECINCIANPDDACYIVVDFESLFNDMSPIVPPKQNGGSPSNIPTLGHYISVKTLQNGQVLSTNSGYFGGMTVSINADNSTTSNIMLK